MYTGLLVNHRTRWYNTSYDIISAYHEAFAETVTSWTSARAQSDDGREIVSEVVMKP